MTDRRPATAPFQMLATGDHLYWITPFELDRLPLSGGSPNTLAQRPAGGLYMGLASDGKNLFFTDEDLAPDGGVGDLALRSAAQ
jgi:hypothetical protein